jgi:hypothetical protein
VVGADEEAAVAGYLSACSRAAARATTKAGCEERVSCPKVISSPYVDFSRAPSERLFRASMTARRTTFRREPKACTNFSPRPFRPLERETG